MNKKLGLSLVLLFLLIFLHTVAVSGLLSDQNMVITETDCTAKKLGRSIPVSAMGDPFLQRKF